VVAASLAELAHHPSAEERQAAVVEANARLRVAERSSLPRLTVQGTVYGRGSGASANGTLGSGADGLGLDLYNWAIGLTATIPLLEQPAAHARRDMEAARLRVEEGRRDETEADLERRLRTAEASLRGARRVAEITPIGVDAARATGDQALARYRAGLGTIVEVADAQRLLAQAEIDDALARLRAWRSYFALVATRDSLDALLQAAGQ